MKNARKEINNFVEVSNDLKQSINKVADIEKVELLAAVIEEQRLRIDSVIQGTCSFVQGFSDETSFLI
jgi:hypothetical protein